MIHLLIYAIKSAIVLTLMLLPGILLMFREKMFCVNRLTLLVILTLSVGLPLCNFSFLSVDEVTAVQTIERDLLQAGIPIENSCLMPEVDVASRFPWFYIVSVCYVVGVVVVVGIRLYEVFSMGRIIRHGSIWSKDESDGIRIFCHAGQIAPFSWLRSIVISSQDYSESGRAIILHEKAHVLHRHSLDILLLTFVEALQWWNPFVYLLGIYLRDIHEYEADDYVLSQGVSCHDYFQLVIRKAVGANSYTFVNNFNHSLTKKRIIMMMKPTPKSWMCSRMLYVIPMATLALSAFATSEFKTVSESIVEMEKVPTVSVTTTDISPIVEVGGKAKMMINRRGKILFSPDESSGLRPVDAAELMAAVKAIDRDCELTIEYDEAGGTELVEDFRSIGSANSLLKINVVKKRFPYIHGSGVEYEGTIRVNADGRIWFYNRADDSCGFYNMETLKSVLSTVKRDGYVLTIMSDNEVSTDVIEQIRRLAREIGVEKIELH